MHQDFQPYNMLTIVRELQARGLFQQIGLQELAPLPFHSRWRTGWKPSLPPTAFHAARMGAECAAAFDEVIHHLIDKYCPTGEVEQSIGARLIYGKPLA